MAKISFSFVFVTLMFVTIAALFSSCAAQPPQLIKANIGDPLVLHLGETALISGTDFGVTLDEIVSDSRCPANVMCIQQGSAKVQISFSLNGDVKKTVTLDTQVQTSQTFDQLTVHLSAVQPYPGTSETHVLDEDRTVAFLLELNNPAN